MLRTTFLLLLCLIVVGCRAQNADKPFQIEEQNEAEPRPKTGSENSDKLLDVEAVVKLLADRDASAEAAAGDPYDYAWQNFVALNRPLTGSSPKFWEGWRQTSTVFLRDGREPAPWGVEDDTPQEVLEKGKSLPNFKTSMVWHNLDTRTQVDGSLLLDRLSPPQVVRYQLLMNRPTFEYVVQRGFYNMDGQELAAEQNAPANFPNTSYELKTSWIWIGADMDKLHALKDKYYVVRSYYETDGSPPSLKVGFAALSGMHIIDKALPNWVWASFENVYNSTYTKAEQELEIPDGAIEANQRYQAALGAAGSIFANYQLDGVQTTFTEAGQPTLLANSNIESAIQKKSSCITCHAIASINKEGEYFNLVDKSGGGVSYYIGVPPSIGDYTSLDFIWSLRRAHWKQR